MHAEYLIIDECSNREAVEAVGEYLPQSDTVSPLALIVEPVDSVNRGAFMVAPKKKNVQGILDFVCKQEAYCLKAVLSSVNIVSKE